MANQIFYATGKRKTSVARVWVSPGQGKFIVNKRALDAYFPREIHRMKIRQPFDVSDTFLAYYITINYFCNIFCSFQKAVLIQWITG